MKFSGGHFSLDEPLSPGHSRKQKTHAWQGIQTHEYRANWQALGFSSVVRYSLFGFGSSKHSVKECFNPNIADLNDFGIHTELVYLSISRETDFSQIMTERQQPRR